MQTREKKKNPSAAESLSCLSLSLIFSLHTELELTENWGHSRWLWWINGRTEEHPLIQRRGDRNLLSKTAQSVCITQCFSRDGASSRRSQRSWQGLRKTVPRGLLMQLFDGTISKEGSLNWTVTSSSPWILLCGCSDVRGDIRSLFPSWKPRYVYSNWGLTDADRSTMSCL